MKISSNSVPEAFVFQMQDLGLLKYLKKNPIITKKYRIFAKLDQVQTVNYYFLFFLSEL